MTMLQTLGIQKGTTVGRTSASVYWGGHRRDNAYGLQKHIEGEGEVYRAEIIHVYDRVLSRSIAIAKGEVRYFMLNDVVFCPASGALEASGHRVRESQHPSQSTRRRDQVLALRDKLPAQAFNYGLQLGLISALNLQRNYFHFLVEDIPRLVVLKTMGVKVLVTGEEILEFQKEALDILGLKIIVARLPIRLENVCFVPHDFFPSVVRPEAAATLRSFVDRLLEDDCPIADKEINAKLAHARGVYVSRRRSSRSVNAESEIERVLDAHGIFTVYAEQMTLRTQAQVFSGQQLLLGPHGAGLTNMVFMRPRARVVEIVRPTYSNPCYSNLAVHLGHEYTDVMVEQSESRDAMIDKLLRAADRVES